MSLPVIENTKPKTTKKCCGCGGCESGYVHSTESLGTVDGPGIRTVVFLSGCPLRCAYCHNIDVTVPKSGDELSPQQLVERVSKNKSYFDRSGGGVTFSGGEPLYQVCFLKKSLQLCQTAGIHTAVDTSLFTAPKNLEKIIPYTDLFLVSVKQLDAKAHQKLTGVSNQVILQNLHTLAKQQKKIWIRYVLIPGMTNTPEYLQRLCELLQEIQPQKIEILPYHQQGADKWKLIGLEYTFGDVHTPSNDQINAVDLHFQSQGFETLRHAY